MQKKPYMVEERVRIDKWLWAVRIFKTRSQATEACRRGKIIIGGVTVKPSREVKTDDIIFVRKLPVVFTYKILAVIEKRVSAELARQCYEDLTSPEELDKMNIKESVFIKRDKGSGRPTKKERRIIDKIKKDHF